MGWVKKIEPDASQLFPVKGQEEMDTNKFRKFYLNVRELFYC